MFYFQKLAGGFWVDVDTGLYVNDFEAAKKVLGGMVATHYEGAREFRVLAECVLKGKKCLIPVLYGNKELVEKGVL